MIFLKFCFNVINECHEEQNLGLRLSDDLQKLVEKRYLYTMHSRKKGPI